MIIDTPSIIDVEASGFGPESYPIEIGLILPNDKTYCFLIKPGDDWTFWDIEAEHIHGITRDMLVRHGLDAKIVASTLNSILKDQTIYSDAWGNDLTWVAMLYEAANIQQTFKIYHLRKIISEDQLELWDNARDQVMLEYDLSRHRASTDAKIIQKTFIHTLKKAG